MRKTSGEREDLPDDVASSKSTGLERTLESVLGLSSSRSEHLSSVTWAGLKAALANAMRAVQDHHTLQVAAALSYYFILALFPGLIVPVSYTHLDVYKRQL